MRLGMFSLTALIAILASFASVHAAEHHGIQVYAGAQLDMEETNFLREKAGADGYCYRTGDRVEKVTAFYQKHPGLTSLGSDTNGGMFVKEENGRTVYIKVQSPWQPAKGGPMKEDTFIGITQE
jgi:hypothetical protein